MNNRWGRPERRSGLQQDPVLGEERTRERARAPGEARRRAAGPGGQPGPREVGGREAAQRVDELLPPQPPPPHDAQGVGLEGLVPDRIGER